MNSHRSRAYIELLLVAAIWGIASPIIKFTLGGIEPVMFLTYRFGISVVIALLLLPKESLIIRNTNLLLLTLLYGFITSTVSLGLLFFGLENTTVLDMSLITLLNPLLVSIAGVHFLNERITKREKVGMGIALTGMVLTVVEPLIQNGDGVTRLSGNLLILGYLLANVVGIVLGKKLLRRGVKPVTMTNYSFIVGFLTLLPFAIPDIKVYGVEVLTSIPIPYHLGVFYMAAISGSLAYYLYNKAQKTIEISEASLFSYLYPVFAAPLAVLWLGEEITSLFIVGAIIIATGVFIAESKKRRRAL